MDARTLVAMNIRRLRVLKGLSQEAFAIDAGIDRTYVSRIERGLENPTVAVLERVAKALGTPIAELLAARRPNEQRPPPLKGGRKKSA